MAGKIGGQSATIQQPAPPAQNQGLTNGQPDPSKIPPQHPHLPPGDQAPGQVPTGAPTK